MGKKLRIVFYVFLGLTTLCLADVMAQFCRDEPYFALAFLISAFFVMFLCYFCQWQAYALCRNLIGRTFSKAVKAARIVLLAVDLVIILYYIVLYVLYLVPRVRGTETYAALLIIISVVILLFVGLPISLILGIVQAVLTRLDKPMPSVQPLVTVLDTQIIAVNRGVRDGESSELIYRDRTGTYHTIDFELCAATYHAEHPNSGGRCIGERNISAFAFVLFTSELQTEIVFEQRYVLPGRGEQLLTGGRRARFHQLQHRIVQTGYVTYDLT